MRASLHIFGLIFLAIILLVFPLVIASSGWTRTYQGESMDILTPYSVIQTQDDGYATAIFGYLRRSDSASGMLTSSYELQILKTDSNGNVQWKKSYPTVEDPNHATPTINTYADTYVIVETADQGYVIAGGGFWLFKIDSQGAILWSRTYTLDGSTGGGLNSMIQTSDAGFALAGTTHTYEGNEDFWLVKTNSQGVAQWNKTYNSGSYTDQGGDSIPRDDVARCVVQTKDGGYALVGGASLYSSSTSSLTYSAWIVKTDSKGNQEWNKGYDLLNLQGYKTTIVQTSDNGYAIAGTQNNDFCLFKIKSSNQLEWSQIYGDPQTDTPCSLVQLEDGGYALAGTWTPTNNISTRNTMGLIRTDSTGKTLWTKTYSAKENVTAITYSRDEAKAMIRTKDGSYAIVGSTQFGSETHQDAFFVKTETLEQPLQTTPLPTPNTEPSNTEDPGQTSQPSSNSSQTDPTQTPSNTNSSNTSDNTSDNTNQIFNQNGILVIVGIVLVIIIAIVGLAVIRIRKKKNLNLK